MPISPRSPNSIKKNVVKFCIACCLLAQLNLALADRVVFKTPTYGFSNTDQHVTSNAKGILFTLKTVEPLYRIRKIKTATVYLVADPPRPVLATNFTIKDLNSGSLLKPVIRKISSPAANNNTEIRYFSTKNLQLIMCENENRFSLDGCAALDDNIEQLIEDGIIYDVTADVIKAQGLFMIEAEGGFIVGHQYVFSYTGTLKYTKNYNAIRTSKVSIDEFEVSSQ